MGLASSGPGQNLELRGGRKLSRSRGGDQEYELMLKRLGPVQIRHSMQYVLFSGFRGNRVDCRRDWGEGGLRERASEGKL